MLMHGPKVVTMDTKAGVGAVRGPLGARFGIVGAIARQSAYARKINIPIQVIGGPGKSLLVKYPIPRRVLLKARIYIAQPSTHPPTPAVQYLDIPLAFCHLLTRTLATRSQDDPRFGSSL